MIDEQTFNLTNDLRQFIHDTDVALGLIKDSKGVYLEQLLGFVKHQCKQWKVTNHLTQMGNELQQLNSDLETFTDGVAHELKNPLTLFLSYADDLRENYELMNRNEINGHLDIIMLQSRKMNEIIEALQLLAHARLRNDIDLMPLEMDRIVAQVISRLQNEFDSKNAQIHLPECWPTSIGYAPWLESVWFNFVNNGLKYGGTPPILSLGAKEQQDGMICFWIQDNGIGLTDAEKEQIFQPFPDIIQSNLRGFGLGLTIVKRIVEKLDGQVGFESDYGHGTTFYFTLPAFWGWFRIRFTLLIHR
ncbi:HAMP domain-containing histidine kinase [Chloroflexi bacterium TSY]|nr:HAMP domain-containing histidine kinase [Chloroflexi bacterium TSY]